MKKILISILLGLFCVNANADEDVMLFFLNDGSFEGFYRDEIDSISYSHYDEDSIWHSEVVMQNIWLRDSVCKIPIDMIDSIRYELPKTEYKSNVIRLDERYTPYISSSDGMSVTFSSNLPASLRPNEGDVLLYEGSSDIFPNGFAGKVTLSGGGTVSCDSVSVEDVYERLYFFGRYLLVEKEKNGVKQYSVRRVKKGKNGNVIDGGSDIFGDYGDDWGIIDNGDGTNVSLPPVSLKQRFDFTKYGISLGTSLSVSAEFIIKCSMVFNVFEPSIFYKCEETDEINGKFEVSYGWEGKPKSNPFIPFSESEVTRISLGDPDKDGHVDWMIVDKDIPVPECPVLTVGAKVGLFMDPKVEAKALMDIETTIKKGYVFSYNLNKQNWRSGGDFVNASLPPEITSDVSLEGKVGGSIWAGILCGVNIGFGTSDKGVKENATVKLGPYLEGYLDLNVLDGISDYSWYSALKDSKMKWGIKWGVDVDFTAALKGLFSYKWTQLSVAPKKLIWEKDLYLFPSFEAPTYSVHGDKLLLFANLTRLSVPNYVGIRLVDETGKETTKWLDEPYWIGWGGDGERPFPTSFIFEGLDFKNHRYTAIPVTRIWKFPILSIPEPAQTCITCTDSNHPHLIDLGLPSGTKWLCTNLYANEPHASGGFYQWGNKYQENSYDNTYSLPPLGSGTIQGTTYDAATSNLGESYVTPTQQQFEELLAVCNVSEKKSPWDFLTSEGIYLKAPNGANLYLPFAGYKDGTKVTSKGHGHYMLADYTNSNWIKYPILHLYGTPLSSYSSEAGYYGYSVRPVSCQNVTRLALSAQTLTLGLGKSETIEITSGSGNYVFERSDDSVIDVRLSGNTLLVKGLKLGTATITVYDRGTGQSEKVEVTVTNEASSLALSTQTLTLTPGKSEIVDVTSGSGSYAAVSNATNVATVTVEGSKLIIKAVAKGTATITVKDNQTQERAKIEVTVKASEVITPGTAIDLGLPSGTLWASCNVGATKPEDFGNYYAWGETEEKDYYYWDSYMCDDAECGTTKDPIYTWNGNKLFADIAGSKYDVATAKWGASWHMPSSAQMDELLNECIWTWCDGDKTKYNGTNVKGYIISSKVNSNKIFLPAAGNYHKDEILYKNESCLYWSSSQFDGSPFEGEANYTNSNSAMGMDYNNKATYTDLRYYGQTIRPVMNAQQPTVQTETITIPGTNVSFKMIGVEGGTFWMGAPDDDREAGSDEKPRHQVKLGSFAIGETEVTQVLWKAVMGSNPSSHQGANLPVEQISRDDCSVFISKLNRLTGRNFRLPTEAEWEYAARGGKNSKGYKYAGGNDIYTVAWYGNNSDGETHPVAQKQPNELGLYDMSGNVWEIVQDYYDTNYYSISSANNPCNTTPSNLYAMRGGGCSNISSFCRVTFRAEQVLLDETHTPVDSNWDIGFRLVMSDNDTPQAYLTCPDDHHPHMIDLGLPSGTLWACCNVGAEKPEDYGGYYAWGETEIKDNYEWRNYKWCDGDYDKLNKYCIHKKYGIVDNKTTLEPEDDVATVKWGGDWRMPTSKEISELSEKCKIEIIIKGNRYDYWETQTSEEKDGYLFIGSNGNCIFLPAAGYKGWGFNPLETGSYCQIWSSNLYVEEYTHSPSYSWSDGACFGGWGKIKMVAGHTGMDIPIEITANQFVPL